MATLLNTDGSQQEVCAETPPSFRLRELQKLVGGLIELVDLPDGRVLVMNEEGKLKGLIVNEQATELAQAVLQVGDYIVGPAVLVSESEIE